MLIHDTSPCLCVSSSACMCDSASASVSVSMSVSMSVPVSMWLYVRVCLCVWSFMWSFMCWCVRGTCAFGYLRTHTEFFPYTHTESHTCTCARLCVSVFVCVRIHTHTHTRTRVHTHKRTHTHVLRCEGRVGDEGWRCFVVCHLWRVGDVIHTCLSPDYFLRATWLSHMCDMTHPYLRRDSFIFVTWPTHPWDMTQSYVWHDSVICVTWLIYRCDMTQLCHRALHEDTCGTRASCHTHEWVTHMNESQLRHATQSQRYSMRHVHTRRVYHMCAMSYSYVSCDAVVSPCVTCVMYIPDGYITCVPRLIGVCDMTRLIRMCMCNTTEMCHRVSHVMGKWCVSFTRVIWLIRMCDMTRLCAWHGSGTWRDAFIFVIWLVDMWDMTRSYVWHASLMCDITQLWLLSQTRRRAPCVRGIRRWRLIHVRDVTHWYGRHHWGVSFCVTYDGCHIWWVSRMVGVTYDGCHIWWVMGMWRHAFMYGAGSCVTPEWCLTYVMGVWDDMTWHGLCHTTHSCAAPRLVSHLSHASHMSWVCETSCGWVCDVTHLRVRQGVAWHLSHASHMWEVGETTHLTPPSHIHVSWVCHMTHLCVGQDSCIFWDLTFRCGTWLMYSQMCDWYCTCGTWRIAMCHMTHCYMSHDSFLCVTWLIPTCHMTHSYVSHDSFLCVTWLIPMCHMTHVWDMTHCYVSHDSSIDTRVISMPYLFANQDVVVIGGGEVHTHIGMYIYICILTYIYMYMYLHTPI